jgi:phosphoglycolate phosphatase-like HAD superfamily hydrolase
MPKNEIVKTFQDFYSGHNFDGLIRNEVWLLDIKILKRIERKYKSGIVTGRPRNETIHTLIKFKTRKYFDTIITMDDVDGKNKPDPYGINLALKKLNVQRAVYLGDNIDDIKSAVSAGVIPIGIIESNIRNREKIVELYRKSGAKPHIKRCK